MGKITAFAFPGQGSQYVGMGKEIYYAAPCGKVLESFYRRAEKALGFDVKGLIFSGPEERLALTENAQPAILLDSFIKYYLLQERVRPDIGAGHSLGEYSALVCAGVLSLEDGLSLVRKRGRYMQEAVPLGKGVMVAVMRLGRDKVEEICQKTKVVVANYNSPQQFVISGERDRVMEAKGRAEEVGAYTKELKVSAPFHSPLMRPAEERLKEDIKETEFVKPLFPVISTVSGEPEEVPKRIKGLLLGQITSQVRWVEYIMKLKELGVKRVIEVGPGTVLTRLGKRIDKEIEHLSFSEVVNRWNLLRR